MRCVYCHDSWKEGIRCTCGAVYHAECVLPVCGTLGCQRTLPKRPTLWQRFQNWSGRFESQSAKPQPKQNPDFFQNLFESINNLEIPKL